MPDAPTPRWDQLRSEFLTDAKELGGTRLLLRAIPGPHGAPAGVPPFEFKDIHFDEPHPGEYSENVLTLNSKEYFRNGPSDWDKWGPIAEGRTTTATGRWGLFWFEHDAGWVQFERIAARAGKSLLALEPAVLADIRHGVLDPLAHPTESTRWLLVLFCLAWGELPGVSLRAAKHVWSRNEWLKVPVNLAARQRLAGRHPGAAAAIMSDPLTDFAAILGSEVFEASAAACLYLSQKTAAPAAVAVAPFMGFAPLAGGDPELPNLLWFLRAFLSAVDQLTVPEGDGRRLPDHEGAVALSMAGDELNAAAIWAEQCLTAEHTKRVDDGSNEGVQVFEIRSGRGGADQNLMAAVVRIRKQLMFPNARWNMVQRHIPGGTHNRFHAGDTLDSPAIELLRSSERILAARVPAEAFPKQKPKTSYPFGQVVSVNMLGDLPPAPVAKPKAAAPPAVPIQGAVAVPGIENGNSPDKFTDPIGNADLARLAEMEEADYMGRQIVEALKASGQAVAVVGPGKRRRWTHAQLRRALPHLPDGKLRAFLQLRFGQT